MGEQLNVRIDIINDNKSKYGKVFLPNVSVRHTTIVFENYDKLEDAIVAVMYNNLIKSEGVVSLLKRYEVDPVYNVYLETELIGTYNLNAEKPAKKVYLELIYSDVTIDCEPNIDDVVCAIIEEYKRNDICIGEVLNSIAVHGLSIENVAIVYAKVYKQIEDDKVVRRSESEDIMLWKDLD